MLQAQAQAMLQTIQLRVGPMAGLPPCVGPKEQRFGSEAAIDQHSELTS